MNLVISLIFITTIVSYLYFFQASVDVYFISTMNGEKAAIKKGKQSAFNDVEGITSIIYRNDLVTIYSEDGYFPTLKNGLRMHLI